MMVDTDCPEISTTGTEADTSTHTSDRKSARPQTAASTKQSGLIEIVLPGRISVRVDAQVDDRALRRVLAALRG